MPKPTDASAAAHAIRLRETLAAIDPTDTPARPGTAKARRPRAAAPTPEAQPKARTYVHREPTGSPVLNAFLHEFRGYRAVPANASILDEHRIAPALFEQARRWWPNLLRATGNEDLAALIEKQTVPITNERAARFLMQLAAGLQGELGDIAREYVDYRRRAGDPERDDRGAHCRMATFAGWLLAKARERCGDHVVDDVKAALRPFVRQASATTRRAPVRAPQGAEDAPQQDARGAAARVRAR